MLKITVNGAEQFIIVSALREDGEPQLANRIAKQDPTNDGPEVEILRQKASNPCKLGS